MCLCLCVGVCIPVHVYFSLLFSHLFSSLFHTPTSTPERNAGCWEEAAAVDRAETQRDSFGSWREKEAMESEREQVIWRLQRLLGDQCDQARVMGGAGRPSVSVCTEDFVRRFRDEMVELQLPDGDAQQRHHALETSNGAQFQSEEPSGGEGPEEPEEHLSDSYSAKPSEEAETGGRLGADELDGSKFCFSQLQMFFFFYSRDCKERTEHTVFWRRSVEF